MSRTQRQDAFTYPVPGQARPLSEQQATAVAIAADDELVSNYLGSYPRALTFSTLRSLIERGLLAECAPEYIQVCVYRYRLTEAGQTAAAALPPLAGGRPPAGGSW